MEYIYSPANLIAIALVIILGATFAGIFVVRRLKSGKEGPEPLSFDGFLNSIIFGALAAAAIILIHTGLLIIQNAQASAVIRDTYGLDLSVWGFPTEMSKLSYPSSEPTRDFEVFGSITDRVQTDGANFREREVYLVWNDGKFGLSESENGEDFIAVEPRG